jgi:hypothetical protein
MHAGHLLHVWMTQITFKPSVITLKPPLSVITLGLSVITLAIIADVPTCFLVDFPSITILHDFRKNLLQLSMQAPPVLILQAVTQFCKTKAKKTVLLSNDASFGSAISDIFIVAYDDLKMTIIKRHS